MKKLIAISDLKVGMYVNGITKSKEKLVVKSKGMIRTQKTIESLVNRGIYELEIDFAKSECEAPSVERKPDQPSVTAPKTIAKPVTTKSFEQHQMDLGSADKLYTQARGIHTRFFKQLKSGQSPDFAALNELSQDIIDSVFDNADALACMVMLKESNDYLIEHGLNCSLLLSLFGKYKNFCQAQIEDLTLAGLLMDCGMTLLPKELLSSTATFSEADKMLMQTHVDIGFELAERFGDMPPIVLDIITNHHERIDGSGYQKGEVDDGISVFAKMAAIVDTYDAMLTDRPFRSSSGAKNVLETMQNDPGLDTELVTEFINAIGLYPVGSIVELKSGKLAFVIQRNRQHPLKPTVMAFYSIRNKHQTEVKRIDLKRTQTDKIVNSATPEEFGINLPRFFREALLP